MKVLQSIFISFIALSLILLTARNGIAKVVVENGVKLVTGLPLKIEKLNIGLSSTLIDVEGLKIYNPAGYEENMMGDIPKIYLDYKLAAFLQGKVHLEAVKIHLEQFTVVKNRNGETNINSIKALQAQTAPKKGSKTPAKNQKMLAVRIDFLELKVGKVIYKDYSGGGAPSIQEYKINLDEKFQNVENLNALVSIIVVKALAGTALANLPDLNLSGLSDSVSGALASSGAMAKQWAEGMEGTLGDAGQMLQNSGLTDEKAAEFMKSAGGEIQDVTQKAQDTAVKAADSLKEKTKSLTEGLKKFSTSLQQ